jgi:hypothetical protein
VRGENASPPRSRRRAIAPPNLAGWSWQSLLRRLAVSSMDGLRRLSRRMVGAQESANQEHGPAGLVRRAAPSPSAPLPAPSSLAPQPQVKGRGMKGPGARQRYPRHQIDPQGVPRNEPGGMSNRLPLSHGGLQFGEVTGEIPEGQLASDTPEKEMFHDGTERVGRSRRISAKTSSAGRSEGLSASCNRPPRNSGKALPWPPRTGLAPTPLASGAPEIDRSEDHA